MMPDARLADKKSYRSIMNATGLIAGSSVVSIIFGLIRTKAFAVLLGPSGVGLIGLYSLVAELTQSLSALGIQSSGVRQIAEAVGSDDVGRIAKTATVLRWTSLFLATGGALLLILVAKPVSSLTFGDSHQAGGVALLAAAVFLQVLSAGQEALLQGMRRIKDLARVRMLAALSSTTVGIPIVYWLREDGIVPSFIAAAGAYLLISWWFSRQVGVSKMSVSVSQMLSESASLLRLGFAFMTSSLLTLGAAYLIRVIVLQEAGFVAAGLYQAAWTLGGLCTGFLIQAMGADFFPRLTAAAKDSLECNRLVNEQTHISIVLAGPSIIAAIVLAPLILRVLYSSEFSAAADPMRWICMGMMLRILAWPIGYIILAKGAHQIFLQTEAMAACIHVGLVWLLAGRLGVEGAAAAFFGLYLWHSIIIYLFARRLSNFQWSDTNKKLAGIYLLACIIVFCSVHYLPFWLAIGIGCSVLGTSGIHTLWSLFELYLPKQAPNTLQLRIREYPFLSRLR
jgi:enterobacterial common antigen flippase